MSTGTKVDLSGEELCIAILFRIFFCELAGNNSLVNGAELVIGIEEEIISEPCLTSWVWLDPISSDNLVDGRPYNLSS